MYPAQKIRRSTFSMWMGFHMFSFFFCVNNLEQAAKELLPAARDGGAAVNAVGQMAVLTLKGTSALNR